MRGIFWINCVQIANDVRQMSNPPGGRPFLGLAVGRMGVYHYIKQSVALERGPVIAAGWHGFSGR